MSRIGKKPIAIPEGVNLEINGEEIKVKGPKGELNLKINPKIRLKKEENQVIIERMGEDKLTRSLHGSTRQLVANMIQGVKDGFEKRLEIKGIGYRVQLAGDKLNLSLGFSHPQEFKAPSGINFSLEKNIIVVKGIDKQMVGQTAAQIRALKPPEPYKGKGIRYLGEEVKTKPGKAVKAVVGAPGAGG